jgi:hypothetical protein
LLCAARLTLGRGTSANLAVTLFSEHNAHFWCAGRLDEIDTKHHISHSTDVTLFGFTLRLGQSIFDQVVFASRHSAQTHPEQPDGDVHRGAHRQTGTPDGDAVSGESLIEDRAAERQPNK